MPTKRQCNGMQPNAAQPSRSWLTGGKRAWRKPTKNSGKLSSTFFGAKSTNPDRVIDLEPNPKAD